MDSCGGDGDELCVGGGFRNWKAVFDQAGDVQRDTFYDKLVSLLASVSNNTESGKIRDVRSPSTVLCAFVDDRVFTHGVILDRPAEECSSKFLPERLCLVCQRW